MLTIVLPLKGRGQFTERFLRQAVTCGRVLVADGSDEPQDCTAGYWDYFYAGPDTSLARWWQKMVIAFDRVETPYAMVADNDDLVTRHISRCVDFLNRNPAYIACSGRLRGFWMWPDKVNGPHWRTSERYAPYDVPADYHDERASDRVLRGFQNSWSYYAVYRTEALKQIWQDVCDMELTNLQVHEKFCAMRALSLGRVRCDPNYTSYLRQYGTSVVAGHNIDFSHNLLTTSLSEDVRKVVQKMQFAGVDTDALLERWARWYDTYLHRNFGTWVQLRRWASRSFPTLRTKHEPLLRACGVIR